MELEVTDAIPPDAAAAIRQGLNAFNADAVGEGGSRPLAVFVTGEDGRVSGGLLGRTGRGWLTIEVFFLAPGGRRSGLGRRVILAAEAEARRRGCRHARVETATFQAPGFYRRLGYTVFAELDDFPGEHRRVFLRKRLDDPETGDGPA